MRNIDRYNTICRDNTFSECAEVTLHVENSYSLNDTMFIFGLFQSGLIFAALTAGLVSICHVIYCRAIICRNSSLLLVLILTGFCHMLVCVYLLQISEQSAELEVPRGGYRHCTDYYLSATLANTIILSAIVHNIIRQNISSTILASITWIGSFGSIIAGLMCVTRLFEYDPPELQQEAFVTLGRTNETHLDVFWSVCKKDVHAEKFRLTVEYGLIYLPIVVIVMFAWYRSFKKNKDLSLLKMQIIDKDCCDDETDLCVCSRLGPAFVAILAYSAFILLIGRPALIAHAYATSGYFRDILPSLLHTVMYCFICSEYLSKALQHKFKIVHTYYSVNNRKAKGILQV